MRYRYTGYRSKRRLRRLLFLITEPVGRTLARYKTWALAGAALCVTAAAILAAVILGNQERPVSFQSTPAASPAMRAQPALTPSPALPSASPADTVQAKYADFYAENQDMAGWITVGNTVIDYPVVQGVDNTYYMDHDFYGEESRHGAIFASAGSGLEDIENTKNVVLYGHHMKDGSMFAGLDAYKDESFFCENSIIRFCTLYRDYEWKVFAVYVSPVTFAYNDTTFLSEASWEKFLNACREKSMFDSGVTPTAQDVVLTLSTCSYEFSNARFVVQAVLIRNPES